MSPQIEQFVRNIREKLPNYSSPEKCAEVLREDFERIAGPLPPAVSADIDAALQIVKAAIEDVEILRRSSLIKKREDWYKGPGPGDRHWPALNGYLLNEKGWAKDAIVSIDDASSEVVSLLANPAQEQFCCRGLVVGYVQSGKTANMTGVIAKAVDAGYNLIVLLGGMTNKLRAQTQRRLETDIVERHRHLWQLYTTAEDDGDFIMPANKSFTMPVPGRAQIAVMKKITSRLNSFHRTIERTPPQVLRKLKVLLIDDECDQASVNSARDDYDMTKINEAIRKIIRSLPAVSYVGYTATPFANVFIDPFPHNREELDDLYPEDFITALPRPDGYFGTKEVFGTDPLDAENETEAEAGQDMIRIIPDEELDRLRPARAADKEIFHPEVTEDLEDALLWYLATCAIRRMRGKSRSHMTMLVHTSPNIIQHTRMAESIRNWISANESDLISGVGPASERLEAVMHEEFKKVPDNGRDYLRPGTLSELIPALREVLGDLEVAIENGESEERLDYTAEAKTYIVVGGAVLARGLTLEGLCVSFFLRTAKQYDTLLQMGRWFGYRFGYDDLPRLWTTHDLASSFRALAHIEEEIREDISAYRDRKTTPLEFAVKVRAIPGMAITSASKMKHAYRTSISYEGRHVQTIRFDHLNDDVVAGNWAAGSKLVDEITAIADVTESPGRVLYQNVPSQAIRKFLTAYNISSAHMDLRKDHLLGFFDSSQSRMPTWNVVLVAPEEGKPSKRSLAGRDTVGLNTRSRLKELTEEGHADIKALMSLRDILIDVESPPERIKGLKWDEVKVLRPGVPLLLLYPIDAISSPKPNSTKREELNAASDLLGIGVVFPGETDRSGDYFQVMIDAPTPEQLDEEEIVEELEPAEIINEQ
ncbi:Z1 domain-containing protein [Ruegeria arenilitoris]|uniref:Z1 domain-containing protein n=1 Tax=Ruegeria arenilitoris TaxID=1173585 RepID=UPI00147F789F|nr:Z1 domain-containing protein [Ruegeria arenilitoris]